MRDTSAPPVARVDVVREDRFGVQLSDPYRWMEAEDGELAGWLSGQGSYAASRLAELPGRAAFRARVEGLTTASTADSAFSLAGDRVFFQRQAAGAAVPVLMATEGPTTRLLLDPAALAGREHSYLDWFVPSPDGRYVACGISQGGSESSTLRVLDADSGQLLPDAIPGTMLGAVSWLRLPEGEALLYHRYLDPPPGAPPDQRRRDSRSCLHRLGTMASRDLVVLARGVSPLVPLSDVDRPLVFAPGGSGWLLALISHGSLSGTFDEKLSVSDLRVPARDGTLIPLRVVHKAGLSLDGTSRAILSGYGSYGALPFWGFAPETLAWYERDGIYAEAGLRGGGEYGREWHEAGSGPRKENTITDFIDCAEYLVGHGYTSPGRLAAEGASAGAIPVGGALVRRPDLFGAVVLQVPSVNDTRAEFTENGPINIPAPSPPSRGCATCSPSTLTCTSPTARRTRPCC
jgi:protease II